MGQPTVIISNPKCAVKGIKKDGWGGDWKIEVCLTSEPHKSVIIHDSVTGNQSKGDMNIHGEKFSYTINPR